MYNQYLQKQQLPSEPTCAPPEPVCEQKPEPCRESRRDNQGLSSLFGGLFGGQKNSSLGQLLDDNTLIVLIILFFLLKGDDGIDHDLLLLAGIFLLIGL